MDYLVIRFKVALIVAIAGTPTLAHLHWNLPLKWDPEKLYLNEEIFGAKSLRQNLLTKILEINSGKPRRKCKRRRTTDLR